MPFRILDQAPQYFVLAGNQLLAGGTLTFYASGTSTLKDTYTDPTLAAPNDNPVVIDASGRASDIWGNGDYRVVCADSAGVEQWTRDNTLGPAELPSQSGEVGAFLTTDGLNLAWADISQVPNQTGQAAKVLSTDGTDAFWTNNFALPALIAGGLLTNDGTTTSWTAAPDNNGLVFGPIRIQYGSGVFPATSQWNTSLNITFATPFSAAPYAVMVTPSGIGPTILEVVLIPSAINQTAGGFLAYADTNLGAIPNTNKIVNNTPFSWIAIGPA